MWLYISVKISQMRSLCGLLQLIMRHGSITGYLSGSGIMPIEFATKMKADHTDLQHTHIWGCPCYVLEPKLQDNHKLPKWNRRAWMGQFLGFSCQNSSTVALVRNPHTGYISPQYHMVFDDKFDTIFHTGKSTEELTKPAMNCLWRVETAMLRRSMMRMECLSTSLSHFLKSGYWSKSVEGTKASWRSRGTHILIGWRIWIPVRWSRN